MLAIEALGIQTNSALTAPPRRRIVERGPTHRTSTHRIQYVSLSSDGGRIYCGQDARSLVIVDAIIADIVAAPLRGIRRGLGQQRRSPAVRNPRASVVDRAFRRIRPQGSLHFGARRSGARFLAGYRRRTLAIQTERAHVIALSANASGSSFLRVERSLKSSEAPNRLLRLDSGTGKRKVVAQFPRTDAMAFCDGARYLAFGDGNGLNTTDGSDVRPFVVPDIERRVPNER